MFSAPEQFAAASKANLEAQLALLSNLASKAFDGAGKIADLHMAALKSSMEESNAAVKQLFAVRDPQEWLSLSAAYAQPTAEKAQAYARHIAGIASELQTEFTKAAESQISETSRKTLQMLEELSKNAPPGSENVLSLFKSAIGNMHAGYDQFNQNSKQAAEIMEAQMSHAVNQITQPLKAGRTGAKK